MKPLEPLEFLFIAGREGVLDAYHNGACGGNKTYSTPAHRVRFKPYLDWVVSVVVVVTGAGVVVCWVVVVELCESLSVSQPVSDNRAAQAAHERISFFIILFADWFVNLQNQIKESAGRRLWGVTLPCPVISSCGIHL